MGKAVAKVTSKVFGGAGSPGMVGTGRFKGSVRKTDTSSFKENLSGSGTQEELRKKQLAQTERLEGRASGKAPSIAEAQLKQATNRSLAQQLAGAQSRKGGSASSRERELAKASSDSRQQIAEQASVAKLQEQQAADQSLGSQLAGQRSQDISLADSDRTSKQSLEQLETKQHLAAQGANLSGFQSAAANRGNFVSGMAQGGMSMVGVSDEDAKKNIKVESESPKESKSFKESLAEAKPEKLESKNKDVELSSAGPFEGAAAGTGKTSDKPKKGGGGGIADIAKLAALSDKEKKKNVNKEGKKSKGKKFSEGFGKHIKKFESGDGTGKQQMAHFAASISDKESKKNVEDANPKSFLDALTAYSYDYKDPNQAGAGEGRHLSVMAQDLEKAGPVGESMVQDTPQGKVVDYGKGFGAMLASQVHMNERMKKMESKKKK